MEEHAHDPSLYERLRLLERLVRRQSVQLEASRQRIAELTRARAQEIVWEAGTSPPSPSPTPPPLRPRRHRRPNPHGLHIVPGFIGAGVAWVWATRLRRVATVSMAAAALTTGAVTPSVITPGSPAHAGPSPVSVRHRDRAVLFPAAQTPAEKKRQPSGRTERSSPASRPSAAGSPQGGGTPAPSPSPSVSPTPVPVPVPSPTPVPTETPQVCPPPPLCDPDSNCCDSDGKLLAARAWLIAKHRLRLAA